MIGPVSHAEGAKRRIRNVTLRKEARQKYLLEVRERYEWTLALLKYCEAAGHPIVFRKADLIALRTP